MSMSRGGLQVLALCALALGAVVAITMPARFLVPLLVGGLLLCIVAAWLWAMQSDAFKYRKGFVWFLMGHLQPSPSNWQRTIELPGQVALLVLPTSVLFGACIGVLFLASVG